MMERIDFDNLLVYKDQMLKVETQGTMPNGEAIVFCGLLRLDELQSHIENRNRFYLDMGSKGKFNITSHYDDGVKKSDELRFYQ